MKYIITTLCILIIFGGQSFAAESSESGSLLLGYEDARESNRRSLEISASVAKGNLETLIGMGLEFGLEGAKYDDQEIMTTFRIGGRYTLGQYPVKPFVGLTAKMGYICYEIDADDDGKDNDDDGIIDEWGEVEKKDNIYEGWLLGVTGLYIDVKAVRISLSVKYPLVTNAEYEWTYGGMVGLKF